MNLFSSKQFQKGVAFYTTISVLLCSFVPVYGKAAQTDSQNNSSLQQVFHRIDTPSDSGFVRSHLEDEPGKEVLSTGNSSPSGDFFSKTASALPEKYDLRDFNFVSSIKDQKKSGCCWAFSAMKAIESNGIRTGLFTQEEADFSENHLAWFSYHPPIDANDPLYGDGMSAPTSSDGSTTTTYAYERGGSATLATFTLARGSGPVPERIAPFDASSAAAMQKMAIDMYSKENLRYNTSYRLKNAICFDEYLVGENYYFSDRSMIQRMKQSIMEHGAMSIGLYYDKTLLKDSATGTTYYQTIYQNSTAVENANHCVTIVGWDDGFSRKNFSPSPVGNGAWLIANSYGSEFGQNGYFWVSYYEPSICDCFNFVLEPATTYQTTYQYDGFGWSSANASDKTDIKAANLFTAKTHSPQSLEAVSFYTLCPNQKYKVEIYRDVSSKPTDGVLVEEATVQGTIPENGYYTIPLATPVHVKAGEKFSVVVTYIRPDSGKVYVPFEGKDKTNTKYTSNYHSKPGQSFLYTQLLTSSKAVWVDLYKIGYHNTCIKVFGNDTDAAEDIEVSLGNITLGVGEHYKLWDGEKSFSVSDSSVVEVTSNGKIKGRKLGTATIAVKTDISIKKYTIIIKKAPSKVKITPSRKKILKKGKTFRIKVKLPAGSASKKITYHSSKSKIASVNAKGIVKAKRKGKAVITVKTFNSQKAKLKIFVKK